VAWISLGKGLQYRKHATRKHGVRFDRYLRGRYTVSEKTVTVSFGWESEWVAGERAKMKAAGRRGLRISFEEYCQGELSRLKQNARRGEGPTTLREDKELREAKAKAEAEAKAEEERQALTFEAYFRKTYMPAAKVSKKKTTCRQEESIFKTWLNPNIGRIRLIDLRPLHIEKIRRDMVKRDKAPRTIQLALATARQVWNHARNNGIVTGDWPGRSVKTGRFDNRRLRFLTPDECDLLLKKLKETSQQVHDMALLSLDTGMRAGEVFSLDWENVDLEAGRVKVMDTKSGRNRIAYMTERVKDMFQSLPNRQGLVFQSNRGQPVTQISKTFERAVADLGFNKGIIDRRNKVTFHTLRHTFASDQVASGTDLYEVKKLLGHSTLALTERYSHVRDENLQAAVKRMEDARKKAAKTRETDEVIPMVCTA